MFDTMISPRETRAAVGSATVCGVRISHPDRVVYPQLGLTKLDLARLYAHLGESMLPHVQGRPLTLVRCPKGVSESDALRTQCGFLRHTPAFHRWAGDAVQRVWIEEQKKVGEYLWVESTRGLVQIINGGILEMHTWNSRVPHVEQPDRVVFDLDPGPDVTWAQLARGALHVRAMLERLGLASWVKTTGGKGLHVVVPFAPRLGWEPCLQFARAFAQTLAAEDPGRFTATFAKTARAGKILIDYKRNVRTSVAIATFSSRARPDASLSIPLGWDEVRPRKAPRRYTASDVRALLQHLREDPWADYWSCDQELMAGLGGIDTGARPRHAPRNRPRTRAGSKARS
jgi:bifunctional non-homologous end joining protein LigD